MAKIIYTHTDEAPLLATYSFLPIVAGVRRQGRRRRRDPRHLARGSDPRRSSGIVDDALAELGALAKTPEANIIKLPNVSASIPQLKAAIKELQEQGYDLPDYPENAADRRGEGRPSRSTTRSRAPRSTRCCARATPTAARRCRSRTTRRRTRTAWARGAPTRRPTSRPWARTTSSPTRSRSSSPADDTLTIKHVAADGTETVLKDGLKVLAGEVVDGTFMDVAALRRFLDRADRPRQGRGRAVLGAPQGHDDEGLRPDHLRPRRAGVLPDALRAVRRAARRRGHLPERRPRCACSARSATCPRATRSRPPSTAGLADGPAMAMVDSDKGITNLHVPVRRHHRRLDAGDDPHRRPHVGPRRRARPTPSR